MKRWGGVVRIGAVSLLGAAGLWPSPVLGGPCVAVDSAFSVDGVHQPPKGFTGSLVSSRLELRRFGACVKNVGLPGFTWRDTTAAARLEVLVGVVAADSISGDRAVVDVLWLAGGAEGEDYRCVVVREGSTRSVRACERTAAS